MSPASPSTSSSAFQFPHEAAELLRSCIHCGLCLGACPTYRENGNENDSPRGRLYLMRGLAEGRLEPVPEVRKHLELCLDCRACETACPSGVHYGRILESTREALWKKDAGAPSHLQRMQQLVFTHLFMRPRALRMLVRGVRFMQRSGLRTVLQRSGLLKLLPARLQELEAQQPEICEDPFRETAPQRFEALGGAPRKRVAFFSGCVMDLMMGEIHRATVRVLQAHGVEVLTVPAQACCGALMFHAGDADTGRSLARQNLIAFHGLQIDAIVNNSAGCGAVLKEYGEWFSDSACNNALEQEQARQFAKLNRDVSELLAELQPVVPLKPIHARVTYDAPCHLLHAQKISGQPIKIIKRIPGIAFIPLPEAEHCCGAAGIYNLVQPQMASQVLARKIDSIASVNPEIVLTGNPGCLLQLRQGVKSAGLNCEVLHPMELFVRALD